jgi:hypothetical protein
LSTEIGHWSDLGAIPIGGAARYIGVMMGIANKSDDCPIYSLNPSYVRAIDP